MKAKALEVRDEGTLICVLCVDMNPDRYAATALDGDKYLLRRCGYPCDGKPNIMLTHMNGSGTPATNDWTMWPELGSARTLKTAHKYIIENWERLKNGDVIDVEHILGETQVPKTSSRFERLTRSKNDNGEPRQQGQ